MSESVSLVDSLLKTGMSSEETLDSLPNHTIEQLKKEWGVDDTKLLMRLRHRSQLVTQKGCCGD